MALHNVAQQLADYRGILGWNAVGANPAIEVELFIKDHPIPIRKVKPTEVSSVPMIDSQSTLDVGFQGVFFSTPDILQVAISGWIITPTYPVGHASFPRWNTPLGNVSYGEIVSNYISGEYTPTAGGALNRKDPDYYITPYGHKYTSPVIALWDCQYTPVQQKQTFSATLYLEK